MPTPSLRATLAAALLCALAGLLAACGGGGGGDGGDFSNEFIRERDGIRLVLASDKA